MPDDRSSDLDEPAAVVVVSAEDGFADILRWHMPRRTYGAVGHDADWTLRSVWRARRSRR